MGRVPDPDVDGVLARPAKAPLLQPHWEAGTPTRRVDDEIGVHRITGVEHDAGHPLPGGVESGLADRGVHDVDIVDACRPGAGSAIPAAAGSARRP